MFHIASKPYHECVEVSANHFELMSDQHMPLCALALRTCRSPARAHVLKAVLRMNSTDISSS